MRPTGVEPATFGLKGLIASGQESPAEAHFFSTKSLHMMTFCNDVIGRLWPSRNAYGP
jgi:hypothetical protein